MDSEKRTASEILLDLEEKVDLLTKYVRNLDNTVKIILHRINDLPAPAPIQPPDEPQVISIDKLKEQVKAAGQVDSSKRRGDWVKFEELPKTNFFAAAKARAGLPVEEESTNTIIAHPSTSPPSSDDEELREEVVHKGTRRGLRVPSSQGPRVSVSQQIFSNQGRPIFLANVEVMDQRGRLVKKTRTNRNGRWVMGLEPGQYTIHVVKRVAPDSGKDPVELTYPVTIPSSSEEMELDPPEL